MKLVLLSGGESGNENFLSKPLKFVSRNYTLIEAYLNHVDVRYSDIEEIFIICEDFQTERYRDIILKNKYPYSINTCSYGDSTSTFDKLTSFVSEMKPSGNLICTYPDIFVFNKKFSSTEISFAHGCLGISVHPLISRFPQVFVDTFSDNVSSISNIRSQWPANANYIFAGELFGRSNDLQKLLLEYSASQSNLNYDLETGFLRFLANKRALKYFLSEGERIWIDSDRDIVQLNEKMDL